MGSADPRGKMDKKLKSENMPTEQFSEWGWGERRYADHIFIQIYFRMHHFVVKFSSPRAQGGIGPPNQNPADTVAYEKKKEDK